MDSKFLGKISKATFGINSENMFGLDLQFSYDGYGVNTSLLIPMELLSGAYSTASIEAFQFVTGLTSIFAAAKCSDVNKLAGCPIEVTIERNMLKNWRILTEVL